MEQVRTQFVSTETLDAACDRIARLEDLARNIAALPDTALSIADLNFYRATVREWRAQARELMA